MLDWYLIPLLVFLVVAAIIIRWTLRRAIVEKLPVADGERVLLTETGLKVYHKVREHYRGRTLTSAATVVLTDKRVIVATGGPEGVHKYLLSQIIEYTTSPPAVKGSGYGAYYAKFRLDNGYATYFVEPENVSVVEKDGQTGVRFDVPFPEHGAFYMNPEVIIYTSRPEVYRKAFRDSLSLP